MHGRRIGFYTLRKIGQQMCKYIVQFSPAIRLLYPDNAVLLAALEAALAACSALDEAIAAEQEVGV